MLFSPNCFVLGKLQRHGVWGKWMKILACFFCLMMVLGCGGDGADEPMAVEDASVPTDMQTVDADLADMTLDNERSQIMNLPIDVNRPMAGLTSPVHVLRTEGNVPHIYAENRIDLMRVYGFLIATDRFWMMDLTRRFGTGRLSGLFGDVVLSTDLTVRAKGAHLVTDQIWGSLGNERRDELTAFAEGVNAYIDAVRVNELPPPSEYQIAFPLLGGNSAVDLMEDFEGRDVAALGAALAEELACPENELRRTRSVDELLGRVEPPIDASSWLDVYADIYDRITPVEYVRTNAPGIQQAPFRARGGPKIYPKRPSGVMPRMLYALENRLQRSRRFQGDILGSNAWAVSGDHTVTGGPILAGDGHLDLSSPAYLHQAGLNLSVFGSEDWQVRGNFFPGVPFLALGTNGKVAWSFTCFYVDIIDYFHESVVLDEAGKPIATVFDGQEEPLTERVEVYQVRSAPGFGGEGGEFRAPRYTLFDGRRLLSIEGRPPQEGEVGVDLGDGPLIFEDTDGDGVISGISFDATYLDAGDMLGGLYGMGTAQNLDEFRAAQRKLVSFGSHFIAIDKDGDLSATGYHAAPCRDNLDRTPDGERFADGASPQLVLDGTRYGGFQISLDADGHPLPGSENSIDCTVPFDEFPRVDSPPEGFLVSGNNDPFGLGFDGSLANDDFYLGGPWDIGFRAKRIDERLRALVDSSSVSVDAMANIQADIQAVHAIRWVPHLLEAVDHARALSASNADIEDESDARLENIYENNRERLEEAASRLAAWIDNGAQTHSGVETFYNQPTDERIIDAVATSIFSFWSASFKTLLLDDLVIIPAHRLTKDNSVGRFIDGLLNGRGPGNPSGLATYRDDLEESSLFDDTRTEAVEGSRELMVVALIDALERASANPIERGIGGFGTSDMSQWLWGLRHMLRVDSIITPFIPDSPALVAFTNLFAITPQVLPLTDDPLDAEDPRRGLPGFPRPGGNYAVDSSEQGYDLNDYAYRAGPVMRMVVGLHSDGSVVGQNIIPGGQSGLKDSPHFADQLALWLGNEAYPLRFHAAEVLDYATTKDRFYPAEQQP